MVSVRNGHIIKIAAYYFGSLVVLHISRYGIGLYRTTGIGQFHFAQNAFEGIPSRLLFFLYFINSNIVAVGQVYGLKMHIIQPDTLSVHIKGAVSAAVAERFAKINLAGIYDREFGKGSYAQLLIERAAAPQGFLKF